jgi:hypothetical protein
MDVDEPHDDGHGDSDLDLDDLGLESVKSTAGPMKVRKFLSLTIQSSNAFRHQSQGPERSQSQMSMASTSSSQSQIGWVGQATKLVSSVLGGSKSKKPQVPSLQRAAVAAKKVRISDSLRTTLTVAV